MDEGEGEGSRHLFDKNNIEIAEAYEKAFD